jgi:uncharacterized OB-fold protein
VSGRGIVYTYSIVYREFTPGLPPPYAVAIVELTEQPELRVLANIVNCRTDEIRIGQQVRALYRDISDAATLLYFEPAR